MFIVFGLIFILPVAIVLQILRIQITEGENLRELWNQQAVSSISIPSERGPILDRNGRVLASDKATFHVAVDPHAEGVTLEVLHNIAAILASHTERPASHYINRIDNASPNSRYVILATGIGYDAHDDLQSIDAPGLIVEEQYRRQYNFNSLASHVLGFMNHEHTGVSGLEASYNSYLQGRDGLQQVRRDRNNRIRQVVGSPRQRPQQGHRLVTTLDTDIQAIVEDELEKGIERTQSQSGTAIVMNPRTGAIKAMANFPTYNPNQPASDPSENRRNNAVADLIEPGSTFKLVTSVAAWENDAISENEVFDTPESGVTQIHGQYMRDHDPLGSLSFAEVIQKSSNIATSEIAMRLEPEILYQYSRNFGFGSRTGVGLPNEESGNLQRPYEWSRVTKPWLSIGYEVQVTPMQVAQAYAAFANDGVMMKPYLVDRVEDQRGNTIVQTRSEKIRRVFESETVEALKPIFEGVVSDSGTANEAKIEHLEIAGKTGTAQKYIDGRYQSRYRASFVGFYPSEDPKYLTFILLDEPGLSFYGGFNAGPIFRNIAKRLISMDEELDLQPENDFELADYVTPDLTGYPVSQASDLLGSLQIRHTTEGDGSRVAGQYPQPGDSIRPDQGMVLKLAGESELISENTGRVPDVTGMSKRRAVHILREAGYHVQPLGSGTIHQQFPEGETAYRKGREVTIRGRAADLTELISTGL